MNPVNILCMKWGSKYPSDYVNVLQRAVAANLSMPHRFVCFTDDASGLSSEVEALRLPAFNLPDAQATPSRGGWHKLGVFRPELYDLKGPALYLDLDITIHASLDPFFEGTDGLAIIRDWYLIKFLINRDRNRVCNSSVFRFQIGEQAQIHDAFLADPKAALANFGNEQQFLGAHARGIHYWPRSWCRSFKRHCAWRCPLSFIFRPLRPKPSVRIMTFHGRPNPADLLKNQWWGSKLRRSYGKVQWVADYWQKYGTEESRNHQASSPPDKS